MRSNLFAIFSIGICLGLSSCGPVINQFKAAETVRCRLSDGCVKLAWDPSPGTVGGYELFWGSSSGLYSESLDVGKNTTATVDELSPGVHYFAVKAYVGSGPSQLYSDFSNEVSASAQAPASGIGHGSPLIPIIPTSAEFSVRIPE